MKLHMINGARKRSSKKRSSRKKTSAKRTPRKTVKKETGTTMAKKRRGRKRRTSTKSKKGLTIVRVNASPKRRGKRRSKRRNPSGGRSGTIVSHLAMWAPKMFGKLATAWVVQRIGQGGRLFGGSPYASATAGQSWGLPQYAAAFAIAYIAPRFLPKVIDRNKFQEGAFDLIFTKLIWTEGISRSGFLQNQFGTAEGAVRSSGGVTEIYSGGQWQMMQGLVEKSPLDGLVEASPMDGYSGGYGHLLPASATAAEINHGKYQGSGYVNPYASAYSYQ